MAEEQIETERLILRRHRLSDFDASLALSRDSEVMRFIGGSSSPEDAWNRLLRYAGHWDLLGYGMYVIEEKATGAVIGDTGIADFHRGLGADFDGRYEMAWVLARQAHGKGYATEAAKAALAAFDAAHPGARTVCIINPFNEPSLRVADRLGFRRFGEAVYKGASVIMFERKSSLSAAA
ncbi:GNAT family N-acetyltransferase [Sphingomonas sp. ID0503]|uniref:GNAT family N-acetyltransferase n=1 Tax=Sphingomonas sp. ID0503 TaxID=3399691 RepID=UPI003AFA829A